MINPSSLQRVVPEIGLYQSDADRVAVIKQWNRRFFRSWRSWVVLVFCAVGMGILLLPLSFLLQRFGMPSWMFGGVVGGIIGGGAVHVLNLLYRKPFARFVRLDLIRRRIPVCLECGYDLRGQEKPRCPECGAAFDESLIGSNRESNVNSEGSEFPPLPR